MSSPWVILTHGSAVRAHDVKGGKPVSLYYGRLTQEVRLRHVWHFMVAGASQVPLYRKIPCTWNGWLSVGGDDQIPGGRRGRQRTRCVLGTFGSSPFDQIE